MGGGMVKLNDKNSILNFVKIRCFLKFFSNFFLFAKFYLVSIQFYSILLSFTSSGTKSYQIPYERQALFRYLSLRVQDHRHAGPIVRDCTGVPPTAPACLQRCAATKKRVQWLTMRSRG